MGVGGQNWEKFGQRSCLMTPKDIMREQGGGGVKTTTQMRH